MKTPTNQILQGDVLERLRQLPPDSVHCVVTSPPYWGLRDYGEPGQIGLEESPKDYVRRIVGVFREVRRVLRSDGTLWLNMGDCYATGAGRVGDHPGGGKQGARWRGDVDRVRDTKRGYRADRLPNGRGDQAAILRRKTRADRDGSHAGKNVAMAALGPMTQPNRMPIDGLKPKDLVGMPWRIAFALQEDGWWLRSDIIWAKPNPMPESVKDRPTKAHEYLFLLTKSERYFYDADAIREPCVWGMPNSPEAFKSPHGQGFTRRAQGEKVPSGWDTRKGDHRKKVGRYKIPEQPNHPLSKHRRQSPPPQPGQSNAFHPMGKNKRSVWQISTTPFPEAHFAVFPKNLVRPCILAGSSQHGACSRCGAPWRRVTRVSYVNPGNRSTNGPRSDDRKQMEFGTAGFKVRKERVTETVGWEKGCPCLSDRVPCIVLDPFMGAGTTGLVAVEEGRHYLGIELNPEFIRIATTRIEKGTK